MSGNEYYRYPPADKFPRCTPVLTFPLRWWMSQAAAEQHPLCRRCLYEFLSWISSEDGGPVMQDLARQVFQQEMEPEDANNRLVMEYAKRTRRPIIHDHELQLQLR
jgi:hypothetical protein